MRIIVYSRPRARRATVVAYVKTLAGKRPITLRLSAKDVEQLQKYARIRKTFRGGYSAYLRQPAVARLLMQFEASKSTDIMWADRVMRGAYRRDPLVRKMIRLRALEKVGGDEKIARAYIKVWLKRNKNWEIPPQAERYAALVMRQYYKYVWLTGSGYVINVPPWD